VVPIGTTHKRLAAVQRVTPAEKKLRKLLAMNVRALRESHQWTLEEAAGRTDMHWRHWQKIEAGEVSVTLRTLARLIEAFGTDAGTLLRSPH